ncbi:MAG: hypothetical protein CL946_12100 [Ectothiorhodospiraceae bacterium]|nr:hypothetical protein [Ectothiorhodospiraceae bacterium]
MGKDFGIGLTLGEPTGVTARFWLSKQNSWDLAAGASYLGNPHIQAGYLWHYNQAFNSRIVSIYLGVGGILGFGEKGKVVIINRRKVDSWYFDDGNDGLLVAARGVAGLQIIPRNTPLDIYLELNPILGLTPDVGFDALVAVGIRFYP